MRVHTPAAAFVLMAALATGCTQAGDGELVVAGRFSIQAGSAARLHPATALDSAAGRIIGDGFVLEYDLSVYADPLAKEEDDADYAAREVVVDGLPARIVTLRSATRFPGRPYLTGIHIPRIASTSLGKLRLTVVCALENAERLAAIERIFLSIRFLRRG